MKNISHIIFLIVFLSSPAKAVSKCKYSDHPSYKRFVEVDYSKIQNYDGLCPTLKTTLCLAIVVCDEGTKDEKTFDVTCPAEGDPKSPQCPKAMKCYEMSYGKNGRNKEATSYKKEGYVF